MPTTIGTALALELRRTNTSLHILFVPALVHPTNFRTTPFTFFSRHLSAEESKQQWIRTKSKNLPDIDSHNGLYMQAATLDGVLDNSIKTLKNYENTIAAMSVAKWKIHLTPVAVDVTVDDMDHLLESKIPSALMQRVNRARTAAGFDGLYPLLTDSAATAV